MAAPSMVPFASLWAGGPNKCAAPRLAGVVWGTRPAHYPARIPLPDAPRRSFWHPHSSDLPTFSRRIKAEQAAHQALKKVAGATAGQIPAWGTRLLGI